MKFDKKSLVDFNDEYKMIYFRHAELLGVDGVVSNVPILKSTLPPYCKAFYVKPHSEDKDLLTVLKKGDRSYGTKPEDIKMFITYQKIDISGNQVDIHSSEFHIYKNIMYRYELEDWIKEMREYRRQYLISKSREIKKKKKAEEEEKERLRGVLNKARITVNNAILEVLYANRIVVGDFYKDGYKYYICSEESGDSARPDKLTEDIIGTTFGTIISPVPIFMGNKRFVELQSINIDKTEVNVENAEHWIRKRIREYDDHERIIIISRIEEIVRGLFKEEFIKNHSYEVANAIKNGFDGRGIIGRIGNDDYVWTNIVTGRSYDYSGRREGEVVYDNIQEE